MDLEEEIYSRGIPRFFLKEGLQANILQRHLKGNGCPSKPKYESTQNDSDGQAWMDLFKAQGFVNPVPSECNTSLPSTQPH
jgi:hypothetical protein